MSKKCVFVFIILLYGSSDEASRETNERVDEIVGNAFDDKSYEEFDASVYFRTTTQISEFYRTTTPAVGVPAGPLYNFIVSLCDVLLEDFRSARIPKYLKLLGKTLKGLGLEYVMRMRVNRFARKLVRLSVYRGELLRPKIASFLKMVTDDKFYRKEMFKTLNSIYTVAQDIDMDNYIYRLKKYGRGRIKRIEKQTKHIFDRVIFDTIKKKEDENDIQSKFRQALIEYMENPQIY